MFVLVPLILASAVAEAPPPAEGVEALCAQVAEKTRTALGGDSASLELSAEGPVVEIGEALRKRCASRLVSDNKDPAQPDRVVRMRVRLFPPDLVAMVEVLAGDQNLLTETVSAPAGTALTGWLAARGTGNETWLAGSVDGNVLAVCGADADADGIAEVAIVTEDSIEFFHWSTSALEFWQRMELPSSLRPHARVPAATAVCGVQNGVFIVGVGVPDRDKGAVFKAEKSISFALTEGIPLSPTGVEPLLARGIGGTPYVRWQNRSFASVAAITNPKGKGTIPAGVTPDGSVVTGDQIGRPGTAGHPTVVTLFDEDDQPDIALTRAVLSRGETTDRIQIFTLQGTGAVRAESGAIKGSIQALGAVEIGKWSRIVAAVTSGKRTQLYAFGRREAP